MFGGLIFQSTVTSATRTVTIPGSNLRFYVDAIISNINPTAVGAKISFIPKGETVNNNLRFVYAESLSVPENTVGTVRASLLSSGDIVLLSRHTLSATTSTGAIAGLPLIYSIQGRELVI